MDAGDDASHGGDDSAHNAESQPQSGAPAAATANTGSRASQGRGPRTVSTMCQALLTEFKAVVNGYTPMMDAAYPQLMAILQDLASLAEPGHDLFCNMALGFWEF